MRIQQGSGGLPLFVVATPGVDTLGYPLLARHMPETTVYKVQGHHRPGSPREPLSAGDLQILAKEYIAEMRTVQPHGPYYIAAMCEGVHIAEKVVVELENQREEVALFAIVDTWVLQNRLVRWRAVLDYYDRRIRSVVRLPFAQQWAVLRDKVTTKLQNLVFRKHEPLDPWAQVYFPGKQFRPQHFRAPVLLFKRPKYPHYYVNDPELGWGERSLGGVETCVVDSAHEDMLREPSARRLAQRLVNRLREITAHLPNRTDVTLVVAQGTELRAPQTEFS